MVVRGVYVTTSSEQSVDGQMVRVVAGGEWLFWWRGELMSDETGLHLTKFTASSLDFLKLKNGSKDFFINF